MMMQSLNGASRILLQHYTQLHKLFFHWLLVVGGIWGSYACLQVVQERFMDTTCTFLLEQLPLTTFFEPKSRSFITQMLFRKSRTGWGGLKTGKAET